jgi:PAS domain S-box-containing protein
MKSESKARILSSLRMFTNAASLVVVGASLMVLAGWFLNIPLLKSFLRGLPAMRFNTALSLLLLGGSVWLLKDQAASLPRRRLGQALVSLVLLLNLLTLSEYLFGWSLGIDEFFVQDLDSPLELFPGRIAPLAILCAGLCGMSLLRLGSRIARYFCYIAATLSFLIILNNLLDFQLLFRNSQSSMVPAHTGAAFLAVSLAILAARPAPELVEIFSSSLPGTRAMRFLLLGIVVLTILIAWLLEEGQSLGVLDPSKDSMLLVVLLIFSYSPLIYLIARDINQAQAKLLVSDQILARVNALVLVADSEGRITYVSPSVKTILGFEPSELLGDGWGKISRRSPVDGGAEKEHSFSSASQILFPSAPYEREIRDRWGNTHWIMWVNAQGPEASIIGVGHDITDRKKSEQALRQSEQELRALSEALEQRVVQRTEDLNRVNAELERASRAKDEFLANMSHELRTPLNSVLGMAELLLEQVRGPLNEYQQKSLRLVQASGQHLLELINDILDLSKIEAGKLQLHPEVIEVTNTCEASLAFVKEQAVKKSIVLEYRPPQARQFLVADPRYLKQILVNLLTNAVKFTPASGRVVLQVVTDPDRGLIQFSVSDTGIGISPENMSHLFQPFVQVESSLNRQYEGTGLGLALIQRLTDLHGGSVQVESEIGRGSCFTINLPWQPDLAFQPGPAETPSETVPQARTEMAYTVSSRPVYRGRILLAEDNLANILTIGEYLESKQYFVVVAHNGLEAISRAAELNPNIILMDIQMPVMDGLEATRRLRADRRFRSTPIVALTALAMPGDRERCLQAGASEYLSKPVSLKQLVKTIDRLTGHDAANVL